MGFYFKLNTMRKFIYLLFIIIFPCLIFGQEVYYSQNSNNKTIAKDQYGNIIATGQKDYSGAIVWKDQYGNIISKQTIDYLGRYVIKDNLGNTTSVIKDNYLGEYEETDQYDYIGMLSPGEEKLAENLRIEKKQNSKLTAEIENADFRVQMEMERAAKAINAKDEFAYQLKEQKAINADQLEELNSLKEINLMLEKSNNKFRRTSIDNQLTSIAAGVFGLFTGFAFKR